MLVDPEPYEYEVYTSKDPKRILNVFVRQVFDMWPNGMIYHANFYRGGPSQYCDDGELRSVDDFLAIDAREISLLIFYRDQDMFDNWNSGERTYESFDNLGPIYMTFQEDKTQEPLEITEEGSTCPFYIFGSLFEFCLGLPDDPRTHPFSKEMQGKIHGLLHQL